MSRLAVVELHKEEFKFSAGHFMLLSDSERESLHGHDYQISIAFHTLITHNGMSFDCRYYKQKLQKICESLDYRFILPSLSPHLRVDELEDKWIVYFNHQALPFLKRDAVVLPITNVTLEELSHWVLEQFTQQKAELVQHNIQSLTVKVYNGRGESGASMWHLNRSQHTALFSITEEDRILN